MLTENSEKKAIKRAKYLYLNFGKDFAISYIFCQFEKFCRDRIETKMKSIRFVREYCEPTEADIAIKDFMDL